MDTVLHRLKFAAVACWALSIPCVQGQSIPLPHVSVGGPAQVAIYYDGPQTLQSEGVLDARQVQNLLGHFNLTGEIIPLDQYRPGQLVGYRAAFFVGTATGTRFPAAFLNDVRNSPRPFAWIGRHLELLLDSPEATRRFGLSYIDYRDDLEFRQVLYKGVTLPKEDPDLNLVAISDAAAVKVVATARNQDGDSYPYALHNGRFWFFADIPFSFMEDGGRYLVFCDLLHDVLEISHPASSLALVRLEDVSTDIDGNNLREIADRMARLRVPFQIAVIPVYRKPSLGIEVRLTDRPTFVQALQYAIARGATPILHGVTHQYQGITGDDFEFWNAIENRAVAGDSADYVLKRLRLGLPEMFASGVYPIAFETPHYAASETDYAALKTAFPLFYERTMATPDLGSIQYFPYPVVDGFGRTVLPENLGYLPEENPDPQILMQRARGLKVVRDGMASFYFHPFLNPALLEQAVQGIASLGYHFVSLREFGGGMSFEGRWAVATSSGKVRLSPDNEFWRMRVYDGAGTMLREQVSDRRSKGAVEVAVEVPAGGWAALECLKEPPQRIPVANWAERLARWWKPLRRPWLTDPGITASSARPAWLLWLAKPSGSEANNQQSYRSALQTFGYRVKQVPVEEFLELPQDGSTILVVPEGAGSRLTSQQQEMILQHVETGGGLVADGRQAWLSKLGFQWSDRRIPVAAVADVLFSEMPLRWQPEELVERFDPPKGARELMVDPESHQLLAVAGSFGSGLYLHLAVPLDSHTPDAVSHYPYLRDYLLEAFPRLASLQSSRLEVYFDPGYREGVDLSRVVRMWKQSGIRVVYAAAWEFQPRYSFDYERLVQLAHQNGIAVYAWFVFPQVTPKMWAERPECRQRTATGADGNVGWRLQMNLEEPVCFQSAMDWMKGVLNAYDWDGVNLAELNFDVDYHDYRRADRFVPMNDHVRSEFKQLAGFDPVLLFDPRSPYYHPRNPGAWKKFQQYREDLVTNLHRRVLKELQPFEQQRNWEVIVTMLDSLHSEYVHPALGVNSERIAGLMKEFDFTLQVEDPAEHWAGPPDRYLRFAQTYLRLVPDRSRLMFDINVVDERSIEGTTLPSLLATGTELARTAKAAAWVSGRVAIYAENSVASQDWALLGEALASQGQLEGTGRSWRIDSPIPTRVLPALEQSYVDGRFWPAASPEGVLLPAGRHELSLDRPWYRFLERGEMQTALLNLSADLLEAQASPAGIALRYSSPGRAVILLNQAPLEVRLEGEAANVPVHSGGGRWWLTAPRGEHSIEIITTSQSGVVLNVWSWFSASAISAYGALTTLLMMVIYAYIRLRRLVRRKGTTG